MKIYTIGYEGKTLDEFVGALAAQGVQTLVDVRELPLSRKPGFSKRGLAAALAERGIHYVHLRELGTPRPMRQQLREDGDYDGFFARYREHLQGESDALDALMETAREGTACLMCFEREPEVCHRSVLAEMLGMAGFAVEHL